MGLYEFDLAGLRYALSIDVWHRQYDITPFRNARTIHFNRMETPQAPVSILNRIAHP